jgi:VanZ family protein
MLNKYRIFLSWTLVVVWMILIYMLSAQPVDQSSHLSSGITEFIMGTTMEHAQFQRQDHLVRKNAHLFNYMILGMLVMNAMRRSGMSWSKAIALVFGLCALFAASDEFHQLFVPGRGAAGKDVLIDSLGALIGISLYGLIARMGRR